MFHENQNGGYAVHVNDVLRPKDAKSDGGVGRRGQAYSQRFKDICTGQ